MTIKTQNKYNPALHNGLWNMRSCTKLSVVIFLLHLMGLPLILVNAMYNIKNYNGAILDEGAWVIAVCATCAAGAAGIIAVFANMRYLWSKNQVDMSMSAPLSMKQKFFSDYLSGLVSYILPFLVAQIFTVVLLTVGLVSFDGKNFAVTSHVDDGQDVYTYFICKEFGNIAPICFKTILCGVFAMIMLYTFTTLIVVCCGTLFESIIHTAAINAVIPVLLYFFWQNVIEENVTVYTVPTLLKFLTFTSPAGAVISYGESVLASGYTSYTTYSMSVINWLIDVVIFSAVCLGAAYFLYKKRRAEDVTKPVVFRWIYGYMVTLALFTAEVLIYGSNVPTFDKTLVLAVIGSFGLYILAEIISNRGFKKVWHGVVRYVLSLAVFAGFIAVVVNTRCFGTEYTVPDADDVSCIYLGYSGLYNADPSYSTTYWAGDEEAAEEFDLYVIRSEENIDRIISIHQSIADYLKLNFELLGGTVIKSDILYSYDFSICYELKSGRRINRYYNNIPISAADEIKELVMSDEYKSQTALFYRNSFEDYDEMCEEYSSITENSEEQPFVRVLNVLTDVTGDVYSANLGKVYLDKEFYNELAEAAYTDVLNRTAENYFTPDSENIYRYFMYPAGESFEFDESCTETVKVLEKYGCLTDIDPDFSDILNEDNYTDTEEKSLSIKMYSPGTNPWYFDISSRLYAYMNNIEYDPTYPCRGIIHYSEELEEIFKVMKPAERYITAEPCYTISVNGNSFIIPSEYTDIAEKVYENGTDTDVSSDCYYGIGIGIR